ACADDDLSRGAPARRQFAKRAAGRNGRDAPLVARRRVVWILRAARPLQRGIWRIGGGHRLDYLDAALRGDYFPGRRVERRVGGESLMVAKSCVNSWVA